MFSKKFANPAHFVLMANVKDAPFKCSFCKKIFISQIHLKRHEERRHKFVHSDEVQEVLGSSKDSTIKAVLNATERIEELLVKLSLKENQQSDKLSLPQTSTRIIVDESPKFNSDALFIGNNDASNESSLEISSHDVFTTNAQVLKSNRLDFHEMQENEALCAVNSSLVESNAIFNKKINISNDLQDINKIDIIDSLDESSLNEKSLSISNTRLKFEIIRKLNQKLEFYGISRNRNGLSDEDALRIGQSVKYERYHFCKKAPEFNEVRKLINQTAERRLKRLKNFQVQ